MIRKDFVSNSSSCSFIINNPKSMAQKESINYLLKIMSYIPCDRKISCDNGCIDFNLNEKKFTDIVRSVNTLPETSKLKNNIELSDSCANIRNTDIFEDTSTLSDVEKEIILTLFENSDSVAFDFGLDDCGNKLQDASALLMALCLKYDIDSCDSEENDFDDIVRMAVEFKKSLE